jgi:hypothetical protein
MSDQRETSWQTMLLTVALVFVIALGGTAAAFAIWLRDLNAPQVAFLGSGNRLSILVTDGPARLLIATGDNRIEFGNALAQVRPVFARRIDVLVLAGGNATLQAPIAIGHDPHARFVATLGPLPPSPEARELASIPPLPMPRHIQLGPSVGVTLETALPYGPDPEKEEIAWRATIERGETRIVVLSDGSAADLFDPAPPASVLAVSGRNPLAAWELEPAAALVANHDAMAGQEQRDLPPRAGAESWAFRVHPGEALRLRFIAGGVALPPDSANEMTGTPISAGRASQLPALAATLRRRERLWPARTRP